MAVFCTEVFVKEECSVKEECVAEEDPLMIKTQIAKGRSKLVSCYS